MVEKVTNQKENKHKFYSYKERRPESNRKFTQRKTKGKHKGNFKGKLPS